MEPAIITGGFALLGATLGFFGTQRAALSAVKRADSTQLRQAVRLVAGEFEQNAFALKVEGDIIAEHGRRSGVELRASRWEEYEASLAKLIKDPEAWATVEAAGQARFVFRGSAEFHSDDLSEHARVAENMRERYTAAIAVLERL